MLLYILIIIQIFITNTLSLAALNWNKTCSHTDTCQTTISYNNQSIISIFSKKVNFKLNSTKQHYCEIGAEKTICRCKKWEKCESLDEIMDHLYIMNLTNSEKVKNQFLPHVLEKLAEFAVNYKEFPIYSRRRFNVAGTCDKVEEVKETIKKRYSSDNRYVMNYNTRGSIAFEIEESVKIGNDTQFMINIYCRLDACEVIKNEELAYLVVEGMQQQLDSDVQYIKTDKDLESIKNQCVCVMRAFQTLAFGKKMFDDWSTETEPDTFLKIERLHGIVDLLISSILVAIFVALIVAIIVMGSISKVPIQQPLSIEHLEQARSRIATCRSMMQEEARKMLTMSQLYKTINLSTIHGKDPVSEGKGGETDKETEKPNE